MIVLQLLQLTNQLLINGKKILEPGGAMTCHNCGGNLKKIITVLPFKIRDNSIVIIKRLPVLQCQNCCEYLLEDQVMEKIDCILSKIDEAAKLEILKYAA